MKKINAPEDDGGYDGYSRILKQYVHRLLIFETALNNENLTVKELMELLSGKERLLIELGPNSYGIDVVDLKTMEVDEYTY